MKEPKKRKEGNASKYITSVKFEITSQKKKTPKL